MSPYAIFMDVDGTLVDHSQIPTQATKDAIARFRAAGHHFFIASGRPLFSAREMANRIAPGLNLIGSNGSVTDLAGEVTHCHLSEAALTGIYDVATHFGIHANLFTQDRVVTVGLSHKRLDQDGHNRVAGDHPELNVVVQSAAELRSFAGAITNGICFDDDLTELAAVRAALGAYTDLDLSSSSANNIEITKHGVNKATAIQAVCQRLGIPMDRTMAFGDGNNDLQMLTTVNYGVAMGNANDTVKAATKYHTLDIHHDGVAHFLTDFFG
ncbi:HAD family hydrolase [Lacticaseibacillus daqingensis]|uniref:HAD family hydrolase n=1 Tax=Lacticaseibacillus daqingensis TaxID=2486014 RepID=UPI0013DE1154|nr:HAD family hydrolase [Lacticaseibacillus daqingensis]